MTLELSEEGFSAIESEEGIQLVFLVAQTGDGELEALANQDMSVNVSERSATVTGELSHFSFATETRGTVVATLGQVDPREQDVGDGFQVAASVILRLGLQTEVTLEGKFLGFGPVFSFSQDFTRTLELDREDDSGRYVTKNPAFLCEEAGLGSYTFVLAGSDILPGLTTADYVHDDP